MLSTYPQQLPGRLGNVAVMGLELVTACLGLGPGFYSRLLLQLSLMAMAPAFTNGVGSYFYAWLRLQL